MFSLFRRWNKFENRSIFDEVKAYEVKAYKKCASFSGHPVESNMWCCHVTTYRVAQKLAQFFVRLNFVSFSIVTLSKVPLKFFVSRFWLLVINCYDTLQQSSEFIANPTQRSYKSCTHWKAKQYKFVHSVFVRRDGSFDSGKTLKRFALHNGFDRKLHNVSDDLCTDTAMSLSLYRCYTWIAKNTRLHYCWLSLDNVLVLFKVCICYSVSAFHIRVSIALLFSYLIFYFSL